MNKVFTESAAAAIMFATIGLTHNAWSGPRSYDLNLLLDEPYPNWAKAATRSSGMPAQTADQAGKDRPAPAKSKVGPHHDYKLNVRFVPWLTQVDGDLKLGNLGTTIDVDDDLGFDDFDSNLAGSVNFRLGRHDFWFDALSIEMSESNTATRTFTFGPITVPLSRTLRSKIDVQLYDIRYGYAFWEMESDGFRLEPTIGVAFMDLDVRVTDQVTGLKGEIEEEFPIPRIGAQGAIPYGNFLFEGKISGLFIDYDDFEGYAVEADVSAAWRPHKNVGFVGGIRVITADIDHKNDNYDMTFWGPYMGIEIRY